jgi:hypothetical protein
MLFHKPQQDLQRLFVRPTNVLEDASDSAAVLRAVTLGRYFTPQTQVVILKGPTLFRQCFDPVTRRRARNERITQVTQQDERHRMLRGHGHGAGGARPGIRAGILADRGDSVAAPDAIERRRIGAITPAKDVNSLGINRFGGCDFIQKMINRLDIQIRGWVAIPLIPMEAGSGGGFLRRGPPTFR